MIDYLKQLIDFFDIVSKSDFALALVLLLVVALCVITINNMVSRMKHELQVALLECREDSLRDMKFNNSLVALASKYQIATLNLTGRARTIPPDIEELRREFTDLRQNMHAETNRRVLRVEAAKKLLGDKGNS